MTTIIDGSGSAEFHTALPVAEGGTGATASTGSGNVVLSASPTLTGTVNTAAITASGNILQSKAGNTELMTLNTNGTVKGGLQALSNQSIRVGSTTNYPTEIVVNNAAKLTVGTNGAVTLASPELSNLAITKSTTQATTSGTAFDFGSIPAGVNRVCIMFRGVSLSSSAHHLIQLSTGGTVLTSGYLSSSYWGGGGESATNGMVWYGGNNAARVISGIMTLQHMGGNIWVNSHAGKYTAPTCSWGGGDVALGGVLDAIRVTNDATGSNTYDAGAINISWEF
jgi:hypothetical protein